MRLLALLNYNTFTYNYFITVLTIQLLALLNKYYYNTFTYTTYDTITYTFPTCTSLHNYKTY